MKWFLARHRETGETIGPLAAEDDQDAPGGYDPKEWAFTAVARELEDFESFDEGGEIVLDSVAKARAQKDRDANDLSRTELVDRIEALERRVAALEPPPASAQMRGKS